MIFKFKINIDMKNETSKLPQNEAMPYDTLLCGVVLEILKEYHESEHGWWCGYAVLQEEIDYKTGKYYSEDAMKIALKELKKQGKVITMPILRESDGKSNGTGWFYNAT